MRTSDSLTLHPISTSIRDKENTIKYSINTSYSSRGFLMEHDDFNRRSPWVTRVWVYFIGWNDKDDSDEIETVHSWSRDEAFRHHMELISKYSVF